MAVGEVFLFVGTIVVAVAVLWAFVRKELADDLLRRRAQMASEDRPAQGARRYRALEAKEDRLAHEAMRHRIAGVRLASLQKLQSEFPDLYRTRDVSRAALADKSPAVRLAAAQFLVTEGFEKDRNRGFQTLRELVARDRSIDVGTQSEALRSLAERAPRETVLPMLDRILDDSPEVLRSWAITGGRFHDEVQSELWREAAAACGTLQHSGAVLRLIAALAWQDPLSASVAAEALGAIGDPKAESALIELLGSGDTDLAIAAARALGRVGTTAAVEPLRARCEKVFTDVTLKRAAHDAIEAIQGRVKGAERGQLDLAEAAGAQGQLSVSDPSQNGQVSFPSVRGPEGESEDE